MGFRYLIGFFFSFGIWVVEKQTLENGATLSEPEKWLSERSETVE